MRHERLPMIYLSYFGNPPPSAHGIRYQYLPSWGALEKPPRDVLPLNASREMLAISVSSLQGIRSRNRNLYAWLREREPEANIGHSIHVYDITGDVEAHLDLARTYLEAGPRLLAIPELRKVLALEPGHGEALRLLSTLGVER
jgi:hypothetical protein